MMWTRAILAFGACAAVGGVAAAARQAGVPPEAASLSTIASEIRLLRESVEKSSNTQAQIQVLGIQISAQQNRLIQTSSRAESIRRDLNTAVLEARTAARNVDGTQAQLSTTSGPPQVKAVIEQQLANLKEVSSLASAKEAQLRAKDSEASQAVQEEQNRWNDLLARLDQIIKK